MNLFIWNLHKNGFTVKSMYKHLINNNTLVAKKVKNNIHTRNLLYEDSSQNKVFHVVYQKGVILTEDNLVRRNWKKVNLLLL